MIMGMGIQAVNWIWTKLLYPDASNQINSKCRVFPQGINEFGGFVCVHVREYIN